MGGGTVVSEEMGMKLEDVTPDQLGKAKKVTITKNDTVILDGAGESEHITERCELIKSSIELTKSDYEREKLQERLAKLSGGVAVIKVGGASAVEEGIVPGGGKALLHCSTKLSELAETQTSNLDQKIGVEIIQRALRAPLHTIATNAGEEGAVICGELIKDNVDINYGFDAQRGLYCNLVDAASVAGLLATSEAMIVDKPDEGAAGGPPGGMGGMPGGMGGMGM